MKAQGLGVSLALLGSLFAAPVIADDKRACPCEACVLDQGHVDEVWGHAYPLTRREPELSKLSSGEQAGARGAQLAREAADAGLPNATCPLPCLTADVRSVYTPEKPHMRPTPGSGALSVQPYGWRIVADCRQTLRNWFEIHTPIARRGREEPSDPQPQTPGQSPTPRD